MSNGFGGAPEPEYCPVDAPYGVKTGTCANEKRNATAAYVNLCTSDLGISTSAVAQPRGRSVVTESAGIRATGPSWRGVHSDRILRGAAPRRNYLKTLTED